MSAGNLSKQRQAHRQAARPLVWLGALLAAYLCAPFINVLQQFSGAGWHDVDSSAVLGALAVSVGSASTAVVLIALGGIPLGYLLARSSSRAMRALGFVVQLPLALPPLASGVLLLFLLGPYSPLGRLTNGALTDSFVGVVLAEMFVAAPFLIVAARSAFGAVDPVLEDVEATLGHGARTRFMRVCLPLAWPAIRAGLVLAWLRAFGEFGATVMVAYHPYSLPVYTYVAFGSQGLPAMIPLLVPTVAIAVVLSLVAAIRWRAPSAAPASDDEDGLQPVALDAVNGNGNRNFGHVLTRSGQPGQPGLPSQPGLRGLSDGGRSDPPQPCESLSFEFKKSLGTFTLDAAWRPAGRRLAIVGQSGSGKSLILRLIAGLEEAALQCVALGGESLASVPAEHRRIAYVPQDYGLFPHMTLEQQLRFAVGSDPRAARYWTAHLGLSELVARKPREMSLGQRQRVALARALVRDAHVILLDEPFSALDTPRRRRLRDTLRQLQREIDAITVLVTHDPDEAALLADEILVLDAGRVLQAGPTRDVFMRPASRKVAELLGLDNVGEAIVVAPDTLDIGGVSINAPTGDLRAGQRAMWRIDGGAHLNTHGRYPGVIESVREPLHDPLDGQCGQEVVAVRFGSATLHLRAPADSGHSEGDACRIDLDPAVTRVWAAR